MIGGGSSMSTEDFIQGLQNNPVMQVVAEQFAQYDVQEKVDFINALLGRVDPVRLVDRPAYDVCEKERARLLRNWVRRQRYHSGKVWHETGEWGEWDPRPEFPCTCGYHLERIFKEE